ncbi:polyprenyl diphosphate synthase [Streptomyces acidicola]|uniref:polyprenyl diphosphate synthase n=1 Tax=Streptomyces acidicola TaxID=2596892 RepID=UPI003792F3FC
MPDRLTSSSNERALRAAYRHCRRAVRRRDPVEYAVMQLTPPALRPAWWALWAAFAAADDIADDPGTDRTERAARLHAWTTRLDSDLAGGRSDDPVRHALVDTVRRWDLDLGRLHRSFTTLAADTGGREFATWAQWSSWVRGTNHSWAVEGLRLLAHAGVHIPLWLDRAESYRRYLDGLYLTDTLADLGDDLSRGELLLPADVLASFPGAEDDLRAGRYTPAVRDLVSHLTGRARRWLHQPELLGGLPPGPAVVFDTATRLFVARLDAVDAAGGKLLHQPTIPSRVTRWRLLVPARAQTALAWRLLSCPVDHRTPPPPAESRGTVVMESGPVTSPPPHPSGARPPSLAPGELPRHVAVIMDGNGRWATQRGLSRSDGHREGSTAVREAFHGALELGLPYLTLYSFSTENWKRSTDEISELFTLCREELRTHRFAQYGVRARWAGSPEGLPEDLVDELLRVQHETRHQTRLTLTLCLNYGGRAELTRAARALAHRAATGQIDPARIHEADLAAQLSLPDLPDVDLLWRTGGEHRVSNFLPWHAAYAELHFTDALWPDTDRRDLWQAVTAYTRRQRRYGSAPRVPEQPRSSATAPV